MPKRLPLRSAAAIAARAMRKMKISRSSSLSVARSAVPAGSYLRGRFCAGKTGKEYKNIDVAVAATAVNSTNPLVGSLTSLIAEGTAENQRVGQKVDIRGLAFEWDVGLSNTSAVAPSFLDCYILLDKSPDGSVVTAANLFVTPSTNLTYLNTFNLDRFVVLRHERFAFSVNGPSCAVWSDYLKLDVNTCYGDPTAVPQTNDLIFAFVSPGTVIANTGMTVAGINRVKYVDA